MQGQVIELPRRRTMARGLMACGVLCVLAGAVSLADSSTSIDPAVLFLCIGVPLMLGPARAAVGKSPRFRATAEGVWFGGGRVIPWADVDCVFEGTLEVERYGRKNTSRSIAIAFRRRRTLLRTPMANWLAAPLAVGDIDLTPGEDGERAVVLASRLEAMRVRACQG
jgi:hypothetical protein